MKKTVMILCGIFLLGMTGSVNADLLEVEKGIIYDSFSDKYWYQRLTDFSDMTYEQQIIEINNLRGNWHMATVDDITAIQNNSISDMITLFEATKRYDNQYYSGSQIWGRFNEALPPASFYPAHYTFVVEDILYTNGKVQQNFFISRHDNHSHEPLLGAWVVTETLATPLPGGVWLLCPGIAGLAGIRRKKFKKDRAQPPLP